MSDILFYASKQIQKLRIFFIYFLTSPSSLQRQIYYLKSTNLFPASPMSLFRSIHERILPLQRLHESPRLSVRSGCSTQRNFLFQQQKLPVSPAENFCFISKKLLFHQQETFVSPARYKSFLQTKQFFCLKDQHVLSFRYSDCKQKIPSP